MSRKCELTGKSPMSGNNVAHSNLKTRRKFVPNIQKKRVFDTESGKWITLKLSAKALRTIDKIGLQAMLRRAEG